MSTIREFAERVVLGTTLEDKIAPPRHDLLDEGRGRGTDVRWPGRPRELALSHHVRTPMPRPTQLVHPRQRAIALHRFANHELQAIEIMAWALLAFPDAPPAFRRGLLGTLAEEQLHLGLYLERLDANGLGFGELPVNDYFWTKVSDLATPLHYVSAMGLVFEAGNLDHSIAYRDAFARAGDAESAAVLARVHEDEIGHVRFGVTWLRRLKDPAASDWDAWLAHLEFPLGPHRAKGPEFHAETRLAAGLSADFVSRLDKVGRAMRV